MMSLPPGAVELVLILLSVMVWPTTRTVADARLLRASRSGSGTLSSRAPVVGADSQLADMAPISSLRGGAFPRAAAFAILAGSAIVAVFPSLPGAAAAVLGTALCYLILRAPLLADRTGSTSAWWAAGWRARTALRRVGTDPALPFAIDLLVVCLRAGMPTSAALRSVAVTVSTDVRLRSGIAPRMRADGGSNGSRAPAGVNEVLAYAAAAVELGSDAETAWSAWIAHPAYGPLARALVVTGESGSAVAGRLTAVARQLRTVAGQQALARAHRTGVALMAPLGLCFLPAFVCLGVVPVVLGIAGQVFG